MINKIRPRPTLIIRAPFHGHSTGCPSGHVHFFDLATAGDFVTVTGQFHRFAQDREGLDQAVDRFGLMIRVALDSRGLRVVGNRGENDRLHIIASVEEELTGVESISLVADQNRDDRRRASHDDQSQVRESVSEAPDVPIQPFADYFIFTRAQDINNGDDGIEIARDDRPAEDVGTGPDLEQSLKRFGTADEAACAGECLGERPDTKVFS